MTRLDFEMKFKNMLEDTKAELTAKEFEKFMKNIRVLVDEDTEG